MKLATLSAFAMLFGAGYAMARRRRASASDP